MNKIYYMWNFKPNEKKSVNNNVIINNIKYINEYEIFTPEKLEPLLKNNIFLDLEELYKLIPKWIIKADLGRLLLIYFNSGIYCDIDCFIKKSFNKILNNDNIKVILFTEHICKNINQLGPRECKNPENILRIANYCFISKIKHHPFIKEVINECLKRLKQLLILEKNIEFNHQDILYCCGPDVITTIYHANKHKYNDIFLCDKTFLNHKKYGSWR